MRRRSRTVSGVSTPARVIAVISAVLVACAAALVPSPADSAHAVTGSDFNPGLIISDELFYDGGAMTSSQIQTFLDGKIGSCLNGNCLNVAVVPVANRAATYGSRTGNLLCSAISGGSISAAELIYRTQVACGISAKVILVTLQKEQGLVTSRSPSDSALQKAMGMACPDTAPCNSAYAGLATQIITGTEQMKDYKANGFARQPGVSYIQYSPNASCGGTNVNIQNYATAALYNYTPYQPNAAALANLGTTGDGCSSYGNRNFWWYYSNWFGSTIVPPCTLNPTRDITQYWTDQGGAGGALGALVSPGIVPGPAGTTIGSYANGAVYCTPGAGAMSVLGALRTKYDALGGPGGPYGSPVSAQTSFSAAGITGLLQSFRGGSLQTSTTTGTFGVQFGPIRDVWAAGGGSGGVLGWPIGDQQTVSGGVRQLFQNGLVMAPTGRPAVTLMGTMLSYWNAGSHSSALGSPTTSSSVWSAGGVTGSLQYFDSGMVLSSTTTGTFSVLTGPIRTAWGAQGGTAGPLGWPTGDQQPSAGGGVQQSFQHGQLFGSGSGAAGSLSGDIATYWSTGSNAALLGAPTGAATAWSAGATTGTLQYFEQGLVMSSSTSGTHAVLNGPMRDAWGARGGSGGAYGWPTGDLKVGSDLTQAFQGGTISVSSGLSGDIATYWGTGSNSSLLGVPTSGPSAFSAGGVSGTLQYFARGLVMSSASTGTYSVLNGPFRDAWGAAGGSGGSLGWPTADQTSISGGIRQAFQHGSVILPATGPAVVLSGDIATYWGTGSNSSLFGVPTSGPSAFSAGGVSGTLQYFDRGLVLSSVATGTYGVLNGAVRTAWGGLGGSGGTLGWPTSSQDTVSGNVHQSFQNGSLTIAPDGTAIVLSGAYFTYWSTGSNATTIGSPVAPVVPWSAGGVTGSYQVFEHGMVMSSTATGTVAVLDGPIRTVWGGAGGSGGSLGWPIQDQQEVSGGIQQKFQHGSVMIPTTGTPYIIPG